MNERIDRVKSHLRENKKAYIAGAAGLAVGVVSVGTAFLLNKDYEAQIVQQVKQIAWRANSNQVVINLTEKSTPSKPVHLVGTNLYFDSLSDASRKTGHSLPKLSRHVNGHIPDLNGDVFEVLQPA